MKRLIVVAIALVLFAVGCSREKTVAPKAERESISYGPDGSGTVVRMVERHIKGSAIPAALRSTWIGDNDDVLVKVQVREDATKGDPELMSYLKVLYVCDWIRGRMYGPPGPGHCWDDGLDCTPNWGPDPYTAQHGDPDATGDQAAPFYQPPNKGDPTADDAKAGDPDADESNADGDGTVVR